jgi:hypothetical protein
MAKKNTETENEQTEPVNEPVAEPEMSTKEKIAKMLADKKADADRAVATANKQAEELAVLEGLDVDSDVESMVDTIKELDAKVVEVKANMTAEIEPLNAQIAEIKAKPEYNLEDSNKTRKDCYDNLVERVGETAAKMLTGSAKATGTSTGKGRGKGGGKSREQAIVAVCDEGLSFAEAATKYDHQGDKERSGEQKVGHLVSRHIKLAVGEGTVVDNGNGTYSRA